jgi:hypothetical protein
MCACTDSGMLEKGTMCPYGLLCMPLKDKTGKTL